MPDEFLPNPKTIVVIGGTGNFGSRICRRLAGEPSTKLIVCSRSKERAQKLASELRNDAGVAVAYAALDHASPTFRERLRALDPDIVIHTAGPFQGQDYRVALACIECGSHYLDLADGRDFVAGFARLDDAAQRRGLLLVSGASTLPGVSSAVIGHLAETFSSIHRVEISIAPGHRTPRGRGTVSAVVSYCGRPFKVWEGGEWLTRYGWQDLRVQRYPVCGRRLSAACDVPDLALLPGHLDGCDTVTFHAALEAWWEQIALWAMAGITRAGLVGDWARFVTAFHWLGSKLNRLGSDTGAMHVRLTGLDARKAPGQSTWYLTARSNHGPEIPCAPALILARKLVRGQVAERGALPCLGLITMPEFVEEMSDFDVSWQVVD